MAGAPIGNQNGIRGRPFTDELRRALAADNFKALRVIVGRLVEKAEEGDHQAATLILERLEGKASQQVDLHVEGGLDIGVTTAELLREKLKESK